MGKMKTTTTIKLKCLICGTQVEMKVPVKSFGQLFYVEVPPRYCGVCFAELEQVVDGREKEEKEEKTDIQGANDVLKKDKFVSLEKLETELGLESGEKEKEGNENETK